MAEYIIGGTVKDLIGLPIKGVEIRVINQTTGENKNSSDAGFEDLVTDGDGQYSVNLNSFDSGFSNGDSIKVLAGDGQHKYYKNEELTTKTHIVNTSGGGGTVDFDGMIISDEAKDSKGFKDRLHRGFNDALSMLGMAGHKLVNSDDGVDLAASFTNVRVDENGDEKFVEIKPGWICVVTSVFVSASAGTDTAVVKLVANDASNGTGSNDLDVSGEMNGTQAAPGFYKFAHPKRVKYIEGVQESVMLSQKGSGTTDDLVAWFEYYLIKEEYNE